MPDKLQRHFNTIGIGLYALALIIVSIAFHDYALRVHWILWGVATVLWFFLMTYLGYKKANMIRAKPLSEKSFGPP